MEAERSADHQVRDTAARQVQPPLTMLLLACVVSAAIITALACGALTLGSQALHRILYASSAPVISLLLLPCAFAGLVWLTRRISPEVSGGGVPQTLAALATDSLPLGARLLSLRVAVTKTLLTSLALGSGAPLGREGPGVQIGAALHLGLAPGLACPSSQPAVRRQLILSGAAAGVAATFGTPLAGLAFAIEPLHGHRKPRALLLPALSTLIAGSLAQQWLPAQRLAIPDAPLLQVASWVAMSACALAAGLLGAVIARGLPLLSRWSVRLVPNSQPLRAALCGLGVALLAAASGGGVLQEGLVDLLQVLSGEQRPVAGQSLLHAMTTVLAAASGIPGGLVTPMLRIGAHAGAELAPWLPHSEPALLALLGMTACLAAVARAPLAATVLVMEWLGAWSLALPLIMTAILAAAVSRALCRQPLFEQLAVVWLRPAAGDGSVPPRSAKGGPDPIP